MIGEIGLKNTEFLPDIVPVLIDVLDDDTPAVVRQAILCGIRLFRSTLEKIAIQVICFFLDSEQLLVQLIGVGTILMMDVIIIMQVLVLCCVWCDC